MTSGAQVIEPRTPDEMFAIRLANDPDAALLLTADGVVRSYRQIGARADRLAAQLRARGAMPGDVVGLYLGNQPNWVGFGAGLVVVWVHHRCLRNRLPTPGGGTAVQARHTTPCRCSRIREPRRRMAVLKVSAEGEPIVSAAERRRCGGRRGGPAGGPGPSSNAAIIFTSGTSGEPKATVHSHERLVFNAHTLRHRPTPRKRAFAHVPPRPTGRRPCRSARLGISQPSAD